MARIDRHAHVHEREHMGSAVSVGSAGTTGAATTTPINMSVENIQRARCEADEAKERIVILCSWLVMSCPPMIRVIVRYWQTTPWVVLFVAVLMVVTVAWIVVLAQKIRTCRYEIAATKQRMRDVRGRDLARRTPT